MNSDSILKILNPINGLLLLNQLVTGIMHHQIPHEQFEIVHQGGGILLAVGVSIHIILNWKWIKVNYFKRKKENSK